MGRKKIALKNLRLRDECEKISRDFLHRIPGMLEELSRSDPYKGIQAWKEVTLFAEAQKSKDTPSTSPMNVNINLVPAKAKTEDTEYIDISEQQKLKMNRENTPPQE